MSAARNLTASTAARSVPCRGSVPLDSVWTTRRCSTSSVVMTLLSTGTDGIGGRRAFGCRSSYDVDQIVAAFPPGAAIRAEGETDRALLVGGGGGIHVFD